MGRAVSRGNLGKHMASNHRKHSNMVEVECQVQEEGQVQEEE